MASGWYGTGLRDCLTGSIDLDTDTLKVMLVGTGYTYDPDHQFVDNGANDATDPSHNEIVATNYTGGYGGAGRQTAGLSVSYDTTNNRVVVALTDETVATLGGVANDTVGGIILIKEITNDAASKLIGFFDITDTPTTGTDFFMDFATAAAGGNLRIAV